MQFQSNIISPSFEESKDKTQYLQMLSENLSVEDEADVQAEPPMVPKEMNEHTDKFEAEWVEEEVVDEAVTFNIF